MKNRNGISTQAIRKHLLLTSDRYSKIRFTGQSPTYDSSVDIHGYNPGPGIWQYITEFDDIHIQDGRLCDGYYRL